MNISFEVTEIKKWKKEKAEEKILQVVDFWDPFVNEIMRECVRLYDTMVTNPQEGHDCVSFETEQKMTKVFRRVVKEIFDRDDEVIVFDDDNDGDKDK